MVLFLGGLVLLLLILVSVLVVGTWSYIRESSSEWSASVPLGGVLPLSGSCPLGLGESVGDCHDVAKLPRVCLLFPLYVFFGVTNYIFRSIIFVFLLPLGMEKFVSCPPLVESRSLVLLLSPDRSRVLPLVCGLDLFVRASVMEIVILSRSRVLFHGFSSLASAPATS